MAGIFGSGRQRDVSESEINPEAVERLTMLASMAIDQIPLPEPGEMTEEEAWTISPGPSKARVGSPGVPKWPRGLRSLQPALYKRPWTPPHSNV